MAQPTAQPRLAGRSAVISPGSASPSGQPCVSKPCTGCSQVQPTCERRCSYVATMTSARKPASSAQGSSSDTSLGAGRGRAGKEERQWAGRRAWVGDVCMGTVLPHPPCHPWSPSSLQLQQCFRPSLLLRPSTAVYRRTVTHLSWRVTRKRSSSGVSADSSLRSTSRLATAVAGGGGGGGWVIQQGI